LHQHFPRALAADLVMELAPVVDPMSVAPANRAIDLETSVGRAHPVIDQRTLAVPVDRAIDPQTLGGQEHRVIALAILVVPDALTSANRADPILADRAVPAETAFKIFQAESPTEASGRIGARSI
jgi:hypothetical protein